MMRKDKTTAQTDFAAACQRMHALANACHNWLLTADGAPTQTVYAESGCLRSARLARLKPVSHELTNRSAVQITVLPAEFNAMGRRLFDHPRWQLLVYSWLGSERTAQLVAHLQQRYDLCGCSFFCVRRCECVKL